MEGILERLLVPDNNVIKAATAELRVAFKQPDFVAQLCSLLDSSSSPQVRQYAAVLLRYIDNEIYSKTYIFLLLYEDLFWGD